jgi:hypothetical protein
MTGRDYLAVARTLAAGPSEAYWRAAVGRAYYALMLEARELLKAWNIRLPPRENIHTVVRLRMMFASDADLIFVGRTLDEYGQLRNKADYNLAPLPDLATAADADEAIRKIEDALADLDAVAADPVRTSAAEADIRARWP